MSAMTIVNILFRWTHVFAACLVVGGAFLLRVVLPAAVSPLEAEQAKGVFLRARRGFKMIVHPAVLALLLSGGYNAWRNWRWYTQNPPLLHGFFGTHLLLGLMAITISVVVLAGREPIRSHQSLMKANLFLMALTILAASVLKWGRDNTPPPPGTYMLPMKHIDGK
jgi:uncharacterized membrane protein